jgi:prevent-host-death family protein
MTISKVIGVTDLQRRFRPVLDEVARAGQSYILTRDSRPEAALIPYQDFLRFQELQETHVLDRFDRMMDRMSHLNAAYSDQEVEGDLSVADEEVKSAL